MKILMLVNWKIQYLDSVPTDMQSPDYYVKGEPYWFFKYFENKDIHVDVVDVRSFKWLEAFEKEKLRFYIWQTLRVLPKLHKYDMVISHGMQSGIVLCLLRRIFGKGRYSHIVFDIGAFNSAREEGKALKLMQFASKALDGVIYHTESQAEYYEKCHPWLQSKAKFIPFGTDTAFFEADFEEDHDIDSNSFILCAGYHQRDWDTLITAYKNSNRKYKLCLLGNQSITVDDSMIEVLPPVNVSEFKELIRKAAFSVIPLEYHNYSYGQMTLLQQMAMGKAVIVADVPSIQTYKQEASFLTYESQNADDLMKCINRLSDDKEFCKNLGRKASMAVRDRFNERIMAKEIEKCILKFQL